MSLCICLGLALHFMEEALHSTTELLEQITQKTRQRLEKGSLFL